MKLAGDATNLPLVHTKAKSLGKEGKSGKKSKSETTKDTMLIEETNLLKLMGEASNSIASNIRNLGTIFSMVKGVEVIENENGGEVAFKFPCKKKLDEVLETFFEKSTKSLDTLSLAPSKLIIEGSKLFFMNKYGLVINRNRKNSIEKLKKDLAIQGPLEIEARSHVLVVWFDTKLSLFKALNDARIQKHKPFPSVQTFRLSVPDAEVEIKETKVEVEDKVKSIKSEKENLRLTEREVFGFLWEKQKGNTRIRDDQVISRLLTNFIKKVSCEELTMEEDGLSLTFSTAAQYRAALEQFCPSSTPSQAQLAQLARKFTLLPASRKFGLFSRKQIKSRHFERFTDCSVKSCGIWFTDKMEMFKALRDPMVNKLYPALFIDCRNIFILSSRNMLVLGKPSSDESMASKPAAINTESSKSNKTTASPSISVTPCLIKTNKQDLKRPSTHVSVEPSTVGHGVMTRAAAA